MRVAVTPTGALFRMMNGMPGEYYVIVSKRRGKNQYEAVFTTASELQKWIKKKQTTNSPRFAVFRVEPVAKYVRTNTALCRYKEIWQVAGALL